MKRFEVWELVNYWEWDLNTLSNAAAKLFVDGLKSGYFDYEDIQDLKGMRSLLAKHILHEYEGDLAERFPEYVFNILADRKPFIIKTDEGEIKVDENNFEEVIPDVVLKELEKQYKFGLWSIAERYANYIFELDSEPFKKLLKEHKRRRKIAELKKNATREAVKVLKSLKSLEAGEIIVSDIEDFRTLLQEHLTNYLGEAFPKAKGKLVNHIAKEIAKSFTEENQEIIQSVITLRTQAIENMRRISL